MCYKLNNMSSGPSHVAATRFDLDIEIATKIVVKGHEVQSVILLSCVALLFVNVPNDFFIYLV